jgi:hypothetical protein
MSHFRKIQVLAMFFLITLCFNGCGESKLSEITGTVTYDGKPVEQGSIAFIPVDGNMGPSGGGSITNGKYHAYKITTGMAKVVINGAQVTGQKKMEYGPSTQTVITSNELLPAKYNTDSELKYEVKPGSQTKDFDLAK